jgi:carbamoyl-phosphate synthase large subunit
MARELAHQPPPNVLVVAAGRRTTLVLAFVEETHSRGARAFAGDVDPLAPALFLADEAVRLPHTDSGNYIEAVLGFVRGSGIRLLVPTIDTDLSVLAANRDAFLSAGCHVAISSPAFVAITLDKWATVDAFARVGIAVPRSWLPGDAELDRLPDRLIVKPRQGSASQHVYRVLRKELAAALTLAPEPVIQEELEGPEITIDALLDFEGRAIHYVPRRRIRTIGGESIQGVTLDHDAGFESWIEGVLTQCAALGAAGPLTIQAFQTAAGPVLTEVNPRFGGGFPLALAAGGRYPAWLLDLAEGRAVAPRLGQFETGLYMTRHHVETFTREPKW